VRGDGKAIAIALETRESEKSGVTRKEGDRMPRQWHTDQYVVYLKYEAVGDKTPRKA
jgi:hypothetical protein